MENVIILLLLWFSEKLLPCFFSSRRRHTRFKCDWSSDVCSSDLEHIGIDLDQDLHAGSMKVINDSLGRWVHADAFASTRTLLDRIQWTDPPKSFAQRLQDNRRLQQQIKREIDVYGYRKIV